tara:strand:- start:1783 stop:2313 length:531 start_codon:yes stop_codon:yes gene_type:complete
MGVHDDRYRKVKNDLQIINDIEDYCPTDKQGWRKWLELNHQKKEAIWLIFYKTKSSKYNLNWSESVDEALCFGWIDNVKRPIDDEKYRQYFSKRKANSTWSKINKDKAEYLQSKNLRIEAGYKTIEIAKNNGSWSVLDDAEALVLPDDLKKEFDVRAGSVKYYESLSKWAKKILLA